MISSHKKILLLIIIFSIFIRILTLQMVETGGDAVGGWFHAKTLYHGLNYTFNHISTRFGMIIPGFLIQKIFGTHPIIYYVAPFLASIISTILLYLIAAKIFSIPIAFFSCILFNSFPEIIIAGSHFKPEMFSVIYILFSLFFFFRYQDNHNKKIFLILSSIFLFIAYETKTTNLLFVPGFILSIWFSTKRIRDVLIFCSCLFCLYLIETLLYNVMAGFKLGRVSVLMLSHFHNNNNLIAIQSLWGLFERYIRLKPFWQLVLILYLISCIYHIFLKREMKRLLLITISLSFFIGITLAVISINPVRPAAPFVSRYLTVTSPFIMIIIVLLLNDIIKYSLTKIKTLNYLINTFRNKINIIALSAGILSIMASITVLQYIDIHKRHYKEATFRLIYDHPFRLLINYNSILDNAYHNGIPIVVEKHEPERFKKKVIAIQTLQSKGYSIQKACKILGINEDEYQYAQLRITLGDYKPGKVFTHLFWDIEAYLDGTNKDVFKILPQMKKQNIEGNEIGIILNDKVKKKKIDDLLRGKETNIILISDNPFRLKQIKLGQIINRNLSLLNKKNIYYEANNPNTLL